MQLDYAVKPTLGQKLRPLLQNWRLLMFVGFFVVLFGGLGYWIFGEILTNGIHYRGGVAEVNLKALGNFYFSDQSGILSDVPPDFRNLNGKKVALTGFMFAGSYAGSEVPKAQLVYNIQKCCFNGPPQVQERVFLNARTDRKLTLYGRDTLVNVVGTLHVRLEKNGEGTITSVYDMTPDNITPAS